VYQVGINKGMYQKYIIHSLYLLYVLATHMVIFRELHYKRQLHQNITQVFKPKQKYEVSNLKKNNTWFKIQN